MEKEKIRLKNGQEFELIPMGIMEYGDFRSFKLLTDITHEEVKVIFLDPSNISQIEYILADNTVNKTYLDCTSLRAVNSLLNYEVDDSTTCDIIEVILCNSEVEKAIQDIKKELTDLTNTVIMSTMI